MALGREQFWRTALDAARAALEADTIDALAATALPILTRAFDASITGCYRWDPAGFVGRVARGMPDPFPGYLERVAGDSFQDAKREVGARVAIITDAVDARALRRSALMHEVFAPMDADRHLVARLGEASQATPWSAALVLCRSRRQPMWTAADAEALAELAPFFGRVVLQPPAALADVVGLLDQVDCPPLLVLDGDGRLVWRSPKAQGLLTRHLGRRWRVPAALADAARTLGALAAGTPRTLRLDLDVRLAAARPLRASLRLARVATTGAVLIIAELRGPATVDAPAKEQLADRYGLTNAESAVVAALMEGLSNPEIGRRLFVSRETVRTHLRHLFAKLGVSSRVEAVLAVRGEQAD